jgi:hypothetical protein
MHQRIIRGLYLAPPLTSEDEVALGEIHQMRKDLRHVLRAPRRWEGGLRRSALARNIQGILVPRGNGRGRYYVAGSPIQEIQERRRASRKPLQDPYPWMRGKLTEKP